MSEPSVGGRLEGWVERLEQVPPLVGPDDTWTLWAVILGGTALAIFLEQRYRWAARLSGPVVALVAAMLLSNFKVMPEKSPVYDVIGGYLVPVALPLLLFRANLLRIVRTTGPMFLTFHVSTVGTLLGGFLAAFLFRSLLPKVPEITAMMNASYIGGGVNFFAVRSALGVPEDLTSSLLVADNFIMAGIFALLVVISNTRWFLKRYPHPHSGEADAEANQRAAAAHWRPKEIALADIAKAMGIAVLIAAASTRLAGAMKEHGPRSMLFDVVADRYVLITFFSVLAATLFPRSMEAIRGSDELGTYLLYIFFFAMGLPASLVAVVARVPLLFAFCLVIALVNLVLTLVVGRIFRIDLEDLLLCVNATLGGPASAAAMSIAKGWPRLVLPALLVGIWGYVIGTALGLFTYHLLAAWL